MKVLNLSLHPKQGGHIKIVVEEAEDIWNLYNLISNGDLLTSNTIRKIQLESSTRSNSKISKPTRVELKVSKVEYDIEGNEMRVSGVNVSENEYIPLGSYHTIKVTINNELKLFKNYWDFMDMKQLDQIINSEKSSEVYIQLVEMGMARLFLLKSVLLKEISSVLVEIPKYRNIGNSYETNKNEFFRKVLNNIITHINFDQIKCFLIAGPGFTQEEFLKWMLKESSEKGYTQITSQRSMIITAKISSAYRQGLEEALKSEALQKIIAHTQALTNSKALEEFYTLMENSPNRVCYGYKQTLYAVEQKAVQKLMVTNKLFRNSDVNERKKYVNLTEKAKFSKSDILIFSDLHITGQELNQITGIAAILRHPLPELDDIED